SACTGRARVRRPSVEAWTRRIRPEPNHASPEMRYSPGPRIVIVPDGDVITDFAPIGNVKSKASPLGRISEYFDVSSFAISGPGATFRRRSHFTLALPSQPGRNRRIG